MKPLLDIVGIDCMFFDVCLIPKQKQNRRQFLLKSVINVVVIADCIQQAIDRCRTRKGGNTVVWDCFI